MNSIDLKKYSSLVSKTDFVKKTGKVSRIIGLVIEGDGPSASVGSLCTIYPKNRMSIQAQVVGFQDKRILLMPLGDIAGIEPGSIIESTEDSPTYRPSNALIGRVIDGNGLPIDGKGPIPGGIEYPLMGCPMNPLAEEFIPEVLYAYHA